MNSAKSKIIQIAVSGETEGDYAKLIALTNDGKIYAMSLSPHVFKGEEESWRSLMLPTEIRTQPKTTL